MKHEEIMKALEDERGGIRLQLEQITSEIEALAKERDDLRNQFARTSTAIDALTGTYQDAKRESPQRGTVLAKIRATLSLAPEGLTVREIADRIGCDYSHAYQNLLRGKKMFIKVARPGTNSPKFRLADEFSGPAALDGDNHANASDNGAQ